MKRPDELRLKLRRQWHNGEQREKRLLEPDQWPLNLSIGKPSPAVMMQDIAAVRSHIQRWRNVAEGEVIWRPVNYRSTAEAVSLPISWMLASAAEWIAAMADETVRQEYLLLCQVIDAVDPLFHKLLVRQRQQLLSRGAEESIKACEVALQLEPGCAHDKPLRALSVGGCDSKFFERNRSLLVKLLELRFGKPELEQGLEQFLGALDESEHWLLLAPLQVGLLPFVQQRVRSSALAQTPLPGTHLLIVENESSLYQLPLLQGTIAILGAGLDLSWLKATWISEKHLAYWGDIDTWGLTMLSRARSHQADLTPLLMDGETFDRYAAENAVVEPVPAGQSVPSLLTEPEAALYLRLFRSAKGRIEQEFIPRSVVERAVSQWHARF